MSDITTGFLPVGTATNGDVVIRMVDGTITTQAAKVDASGNQYVVLSTGTSTIGIVNQGTQGSNASPWFVLDSSDGPVAGGTAASYSSLAGGIFTSATGLGSALTAGQQAALQLDANGLLLVNLVTPLPAGSNLIGSVNLDSGGTPITNTGGSLNVNITGGTVDTGVVDQSAFVYGTGVEQPIGGVYQDTAPTLTAGTTGAIRSTANRGLHVNLRDAAGNEKLGSSTSANSIPVVIASDQGAVDVKDGSDGPVTPGTAATFSSLSGMVYNSAAPAPTSGQQLALQSDAAGNLLVNLSTPIPTGTNTIGSVKITDGVNTVAIAPASTAATATQAAEVVALSPNSPLPAGTNLIGGATVYVGSNLASVSNPLPVTVTSASPGTPVQDYHTSAALAVGASVTFTYTVPATHVFSFERAWISGSGRLKAEVKNNGSTIMVGFNSAANPNIDMTITAPPSVLAGNNVSITITNEQQNAGGGAFDVYATVEGILVT